MKRTRKVGRLLCVVWLLSILCMFLSGCNAAEETSIASVR